MAVYGLLPESTAFHKLLTRALPVYCQLTSQPLIALLPLLVMEICAVKPPPQLFVTLYSQAAPPLSELLELDEELLELEEELLELDDEDELDDELDELEELDDELELLEELEELTEELLPSHTWITPPSPPFWLLQVVIPIQLKLFSQPQPLSWFWHNGRGSS